VPAVAAEQYVRIFREVMAASLPDYSPLPWSKFKVDPVYRKRWTALCPKSVRNFIRRAFVS
jgi:hypothetical protein